MNGKIKYLLPSIGQTLFLAVFLTLFFHSECPLLRDGDTGIHVRTGEVILDTLSVPARDIFSFHSPPLPWTAHEWLSEVVMALLHRAFGLTGVVLFFILLISLTYFLLFKVLRTNGGNILADTFLVFLVIISSYLHWLARPHIFSLFLLVVWSSLLDSFQRYGKTRSLFYLPPLMLLWVNLHGGFIIGFLLVGIYFLGNLAKYGFSHGSEKEQAKAIARNLGFTLLGCFLVSLINPYGYRLLSFPFTLVTNRYFVDNVVEFLSPDFHKILPFKYLLFFMIAIFAISPKPASLVELALVLVFTGMAIYSYRYIPLYCVIIAPILSRQAKSLLARSEGPRRKNFHNEAENIASIDSFVKGYLLIFVALVIVIAVATKGNLEFVFDGKKKPVAAVDFLKKENIKGNMFNMDEFGDFLIYLAYPQYRVFIDGRLDVYGAEKFKEYIKVVILGPGWEKVLEKYDIGWIFFDANSVLSRSLYEKKGWRLIYADNVANIFAKERAEYQDLIQKYGNVTPVANGEKKAGD